MSHPADGSRRDLGLEHLGSGGRGDRLRFRMVVRILVRCLPFLRGYWKHVFGLIGGFVVVTLPSLGLGLMFFVIWWNSVLADGPLAPWQAGFLGLDPAVFAEVDALSEAQRADISRILVWSRGLPLLPLFLGGFLGLVYYRIWILQGVNQAVRLHLIDRLQELSLRFHAETRVGDAIYRIYQDSAMVTQLIDVLFLAPIRFSLAFFVGLVGVAVYHPGFAAILAAIWPPTLLFGLWVSWRLRVRFRGARETNSGLTSRIQESLAGIKVIKAYGLERYEQGRFERDSRAAFTAAFRARTLLAVLGVVIFTITAALTLGANFWITLETIEGGRLWVWRLLEGSAFEPLLAATGLTVWTLGSFNAFKWLFGQGSGATEQIYRVWGRTQDIAIGLDRVFEILDLEPEVRDAPDAIEMPTFESSVAFREVAFRYQDDRPVLESVDLFAKMGTIIAIVGPTGSGKSTLMALLIRLFDPTRGSIEIDGRDLRQLRVDSVRRNVAIALQENVLFGTTVRENIRYAVPDASDARVRAAARVACADQFIEALPEGYDTLLGERGTKLSTGQRQRLSIARAVLKDTPILILDEPTASLDAETELQLLRNLGDWGRGRVVFLITHRLSTIRRADLITYLEAGTIGETGSHQELMQRDRGAYRSLVEAEEGRVA